MNEDRSVGREVQRKKRHSFWWVWVLLILIAFGGGVIVGLKLNTMPLPNEMKDRLYPVLESYIPGSTAVHAPAAPVPVPTPAQEIAAEAEALPAPEETARAGRDGCAGGDRSARSRRDLRAREYACADGEARGAGDGGGRDFQRE